MRFLILSALEAPERQEVKTMLGDVSVNYHPITNTDYYVGNLTVNGQNHAIMLGRTDQTNINSGIETERALAHLKPDYVFFLGVAGGLKDVRIGDIVVGKDVYGYERGKVIKGSFLPRPSFGFSNYEMERMSSIFVHSDEWQEISKTIYHHNFTHAIQVLSGTIAAGEKVDASEASDLHQFLKIHCSHALAVEMEGLGFLEACRHHPEIKSLLVRGISDLVENKSITDAFRTQNYASLNAAKFVFGLIKFLLKKEEAKDWLTLDKDQLSALLQAARDHYPEGLKERAIWERAGGELSKLTLNGVSGRAQWFEGLKLIEKGGAGKVTYTSLLNEMLEDFGSSQTIHSIAKMFSKKN